MASTTIILEAKKRIGKTLEPFVSLVQSLSASNRVAAMLKKPQLATEGQDFSDSRQKKTNPLASRKSVKKISKLQRKVFNEITNYSTSGNFLSMRDFEKILPYKRSKIGYALVCLQNLGLISCVRAERIIHYCPSEQFKSLKKQEHTLAVYDKIEREIIHTISESLKKLYPGALESVSEFSGSAESNCFDIVFKFNSRVMGKQFLVVDVFTKIPLTEQIVQSFSKKIRLTCIESKQRFHGDMVCRYPLRGKTLGMLICNITSQKAIEDAKDRDISLLYFRDFQSCYNQLHKLVNLIQRMH